ncbi:hypothetical protein J2R96_005889 [Bradyrhizobium elkanii]|nr:hypothetical protein [Bradyrhizobium elkanii]
MKVRREPRLRASLLREKMLFYLPSKRRRKGKKDPASREAGSTIRTDQSPLRRDQIRVKLSSPSTLTSEA